MATNNKIIELFTLRGIYQYYGESTFYYDDGLRVIYTLEDNKGNLYSWRTSKAGAMGEPVLDENGDEIDWNPVRLGGKVALKGTITGSGEYKGVPRTYLSRCKVLEIVDFGPTYEEYIEMKRAEQLAGRNCEVKRISYGDYKNNYSDYEALYESFERTDHGCFISVLIEN